MKKIYYLLLALLATGFTFTACSDEDPFETVSESDFPMILDPVFPDRQSDGSLPIVATLNRDQTYELTARVTPSEYTTVKWYVDGVEVMTGLEFSALFKAGTYNLKIVATTTNGQSSYREGTLQIDPLDTDPWASTVSFERIVAPGSTARLYGNNLNLVEYLVIDGQRISTNFVDAGGNSYIEYTVPAGLADGDYRITLGDSNGTEYGGGVLTVTSGTLMTAGFNRVIKGSEWVITGINLDQVTSLTVGSETITDFLRQSSTEIALECPNLEAGNYTLSGQTTGGSLSFYTANGNVTETTVTITEETVLWEGHQYISWDYKEPDPRHHFNIVPGILPLESYKEILQVGSVLKLGYSIESSAEYHQIQLTYPDWDPRIISVDVATDGVFEYTITQEVYDAIQNEGGLIIVGHGFYLDMVSVQ